MPRHGGARPGAGRHKGSFSETTRIALALREKFSQTVERRWKEIEEATYDLALGHYFQETDRNGNKRVYTKSPDWQTLKSIHEQIMGRPKESVEVDSPALNDELKTLNEKLGKVFDDVKNNRTGV